MEELRPCPQRAYLICVNLCLVERCLLQITEDTALTPVTQEIPRIWGILCQELGAEVQLCPFHSITTSKYSMQREQNN